jgi:acetyl-CoA carboxylase biotin carboxylase subunit
MIKKLLIANRGEIVCRIIRACRDLGVKTVAVYSEADKDAYYAKQADESYHIGPANPVRSYLDIDAIINAAKKSGADAVHPGYGFLSENAAFATAVAEAGITWVGPSPQVLKTIESKLQCKVIAVAASVPVIPGTVTSVKDENDILDFVAEFGFPILLKLDKGGGGKGIESVKENDNVKEIYERVARIGYSAFSSPDCFIEKEIVRPRHIEVQFLADQYDHCVCLGERECSIQRRHQKIIEESPSPVVSAQDRNNLYDYTTKLVRAMGYQGAGTIEFLRSEDGQFYFMEVNARLQVEHPVSEMVTGIDIVRNQITIAAGQKLDFQQEDIQLNGHAIEARIYAEDPVNFTPSPGTITELHLPQTDSVLRIEHALEAGGKVPPYYDPMLAKVITWGATRPVALQRLISALTQIHIEGVKTTILTNLKILDHQQYVAGTFDVSFIEKEILQKAV